MSYDIPLYRYLLAFVVGSCGILAILHAFYGVLDSKGRRINWGISLASAWIGLEAAAFLIRIGLSDSEGALLAYYIQQALKYSLPLAILILIHQIGPPTPTNPVGPQSFGAMFLLTVLAFAILYFTNNGIGHQQQVKLPWGETFWQFRESPTSAQASNGVLLVGTALILWVTLRKGDALGKQVALLYGISIAIDLIGRISGAWDFRIRWFGFALLPMVLHWHLMRQQLRALTISNELEKERFRLQELVQEQETILRAAVHDFRSPLASISGFANEIRLSAADSGNAQEIGQCLDYVEKGVSRLQKLLQGLISILSIGRIEAHSEPICNLNELIADLLALLAPQLHNAKIETQIKHTFSADINMLLQIVQNLLENAAKYRHPQRDLHIRLFTTHHGSEVCLHCQDNGMGIAPQEIDTMGTPFVRGSNAAGIPGYGVGLSICRKDMVKMNGYLSVASEFGEGTTITLHFPVFAT